MKREFPFSPFPKGWYQVALGSDVHLGYGGKVVEDTLHQRPLLCDGDGPIPELRRWGLQFYPELGDD